VPERESGNEARGWMVAASQTTGGGASKRSTALAAYADARLARKLLSETITELSTGEWRLHECGVVDVRRKMRKVIAAYDLTYVDGEGRLRTEALIAKMYGTDRGRHGHEALRSLWAAGFRPPARFSVPRPHGYSARRRALVQERAIGTPWADHLGGGLRSLRKASREGAGWLLCLQRTRIAWDADDAVREHSTARSRAEEIAEAYPRHAAWLEPLGDWLASQLEPDTRPPVPSHGDFHPKNVFLAPGRVTVIDFDTFGRREAAFDVGYAMGQLLVMSKLRLGDLGPGTDAAGAFYRQYCRGRFIEWQRVALHVARTLVQSLHYELCVLRRSDRSELLWLWRSLIDDALVSDEVEAFENRLRNR
jgi:Phosphotransferase enzyme family